MASLAIQGETLGGSLTVGQCRELQPPSLWDHKDLRPLFQQVVGPLFGSLQVSGLQVAKLRALRELPGRELVPEKKIVKKIVNIVIVSSSTVFSV